MESSTQINIRMDRSLKEAGDAALAQIGLNPSQAVRALWEKASHRGKDLEEVSALLCERNKQYSKDEGKAGEDEELQASWTLVEDTLASHGMVYMPTNDSPDDKAMLEEALYGRLVERGLV